MTVQTVALTRVIKSIAKGVVVSTMGPREGLMAP